jgi:hypothetical protein
MPADVRIEIENYKRLLAAMNHKVRFIVLDVLGDPAEDALSRL